MGTTRLAVGWSLAALLAGCNVLWPFGGQQRGSQADGAGAWLDVGAVVGDGAGGDGPRDGVADGQSRDLRFLEQGSPPPQDSGQPPPKDHQVAPAPDAHPTLKDKGTPPPQDSYLPPPQDSYLPPPQDSYLPPPQDSYLPPPQDSYLPPPQDSYLPPPQDSYLPPPQDSYLPPPQDSYVPPQDFPVWPPADAGTPPDAWMPADTAAPPYPDIWFPDMAQPPDGGPDAGDGGTSSCGSPADWTCIETQGGCELHCGGQAFPYVACDGTNKCSCPKSTTLVKLCGTYTAADPCTRCWSAYYDGCCS